MSYSAGVSFTSPSINAFDQYQRPISIAFPQMTGNSVYPTANLAIYEPVRVAAAVVVKQMFLGVVTAAGTVDLGIYDAAGTRVVSTGLVAASTACIHAVTTTTLQQGLYYLAVTATSTSLNLARSVFGAGYQASGGYKVEQLGAGSALPATATWTVSQTAAYQPVIAALRSSTNS